jgi:hypothetical protein
MIVQYSLTRLQTRGQSVNLHREKYHQQRLHPDEINNISATTVRTPAFLPATDSGQHHGAGETRARGWQIWIAAFAVPVSESVDVRLRSIVGVSLHTVSHSAEDRSHGSGVASQFVSNDSQWFNILTAQASSKESICNGDHDAVAPDVDQVAILINSRSFLTRVRTLDASIDTVLHLFYGR